MSIAYTYTIARVDADARCMEIVYQSPNRPEVRMGARIPFKGESLDAVVKQYAPVAYWAELEAELQVPDVGVQGSIEPADLGAAPKTPDEALKAKLAELADWRYIREVSGVMVGGIRVATDRESQSKVASTLLGMSQGLITTVRWKTAAGSWVELGVDEMRSIAQSVVSHVQMSFDLEKLYSDQVRELAASGATTEQILAFSPGHVFDVGAMPSD